MATTSIPGYYTVSEAASRMGVSISSVHRYIELGQLDAIRLGKQHLLPARAVDDFQRRPVGNPLWLAKSGS